MQHATAAPSSRASTRPTARSVRFHDQRQQIIGLLTLLVATSLFFAPWLPGDPQAAKDAHVNELAVGLVVLAVGAARFARLPGRRSDLAIMTAGVWLIASPWVLSAGDTRVMDGAQYFDVAAGAVLVVLAAVSLALLAASRTADAGASSARRR